MRRSVRSNGASLKRGGRSAAACARVDMRMSDERLIDDVARQMTEGQPSADFRARVIAALDNPPRRTTRSAWLLAPVAAAALALIAIVLFRGNHEAVHRPDPVGPRASETIARAVPPAE